MTDERDRKLAHEWLRSQLRREEDSESSCSYIGKFLLGGAHPSQIEALDAEAIDQLAEVIAPLLSRVRGEGCGVYRCEGCKIDWQPELVRRATIPCGECGKQCAPPPEKEGQKP